MLSPPALRAAIQGERLIMNENSTLNALICREFIPAEEGRK